MGKAKLTEVTLSVFNTHDKAVLLQIRPEGRSFTAIPHEDTFLWRKLVEMFGQEASVSREQISLSARDLMSADAELRKLFRSKRGLRSSPSTNLHFTRDGIKFTVQVCPSNPPQCYIHTDSSSVQLNSKNPRAAGYVIALQDSPYCESVTMKSYGGISVDLTQKYSTPSQQLVACEALVNLY